MPRGRAARAAAVLAVALLAVTMAAAGPGCEPTRLEGIVLLYGSDNQGVIAACGCPSNPSGGFAKRQGLIEHYRRTRRDVLVVDAGNLFPDYDHPVKVTYLAKALARARYDALGMGDQEFALGLPRLRQLQEEYGLPFLCANVRDDAGHLVMPPHVVREVEGRRIGIFSVIADVVYGWPPHEWRQGLKVESPVEAARREVQDLADCDVVVALVHESIEGTRKLAAEVPGIHVIICGHDRIVLRKPEPAGSALIAATGEAGRILGAMTIAAGGDGAPRFANDLTDLSAHVPEATWVMDLYWEYVKVSKDKPPPDWDQTPIPPRYDPPEACQKCHPAEYRQWKTTRHARAYQSIRKAGRHEDPECLMCHTMGFGRQGGFVSMDETPSLGRVTCQGCHIVAADHADKKIKPEPQINISSRLCMSCHGPVQSPDFDYFVYKPKILHRPRDGVGGPKPGSVPGK